uniref:Uncharacterized protein n=1 Tax=Chlorobium chlorochromatii (strain CaD3) TaxID=340177 RepID=Q3ARE8_CHLCH
MPLKPHFTIIGLLGVAVLVQEFALNRLTLFHAAPDMVTIGIAVLALLQGQKKSTTAGFIVGTIIGMISGNMGMAMLSRSVEGFIAGYFYEPEDSHATSHQIRRSFFFAILLSGFVANALLSLGDNPLALPLAYRLLATGIAEALMTYLLAWLLHWLFLKKLLAD